MTLLENVATAFVDMFDREPESIIQAPGRVNLIGEHTDYNDGFVFPCAIAFATVVAGAKREDISVYVHAIDYEETDSFSVFAEIAHHQSKLWANYVRGVVSTLVSEGYVVEGFSLSISGNVPQGAGLSSSAALEVAVLELINDLFELGISKKGIALLAQKAENEFVGCACGIMDQLISACGIEGRALAIDCRSLSWQEVTLPDEYTVMMINSNVKRGLVDSEYNVRRQQCESAAHYFNVSHLRDVSIKQFNQASSELDPIVAKRAKHVIYENQRTLDAVTAFENRDTAKISQLMSESHESMKMLFEITTPEIDYLVSLVSEVLGDSGGARMTGGGFGGCVVALVPDNLVENVKQVVSNHYYNETGIKEDIYISKAVKGVGRI